MWRELRCRTRSSVHSLDVLVVKLLRHPPAAAAAQERELLCRRVQRRAIAAIVRKITVDDGEILILIDRVERQAQAEAVGQRNPLLHRLAEMDFGADQLGALIA